ncbi:MAG TPA: hypothetical protein DCG42_06340 [Maribacter sp.]|jgi:hypothetical protein|nr:hypothetical protein [Maribacter sp.]|tara:strand:+ start:147 stop:488 length:342 start_codon:yes stop_codon:yes gene_type:complete
MSRLEIILSSILFLSFLFNLGVFAYARAAISRLLTVSEELGDLQEMINSFCIHLKKVYELESFYGDETLNALLQHAISFNEQMETFEFIYSLTEAEGDAEDDDGKDSEEEKTS